MRIELDAFSGRPNPTWSLDDQDSQALLARFKLLKPSDSKRPLRDGLGYRGFRLVGFQDYDEVAVWNEIVEASRGGKQYRWHDEGRRLERYLLSTSKGHIDEAVYRSIASAIEEH